MGYYDKAGGWCGSEVYETNSAVSDDSTLSEEVCEKLSTKHFLVCICL